ncbi:PREDICTED: tRNA 2'-phosphotransferase 1 isoform X1 [Hipposideros armiger]|uniref:2'-phosphotransferase n=1 Tax=Hipposideros armiger TaxID=186990 RepID=A0A8B7RIH4_HIPAR|nr:PREDICTED: tRNA 2'-phosphotransferase 1 isoform X1 [Hipposideros armiger]
MHFGEWRVPGGNTAGPIQGSCFQPWTRRDPYQGSEAPASSWHSPPTQLSGSAPFPERKCPPLLPWLLIGRSRPSGARGVSCPAVAVGFGYELFWRKEAGSSEAQGQKGSQTPGTAGHSEFRVGSRAGSPQGPGATSGLLQDGDVQLSKALSYALRHGALKLGLPMGADGFVPLGALLQLPQFHSFSAEDVQRVVDTSGKQRFALKPGDPSTGPLIRANQGHSLQVPELELMPLETPQALPLMLVHGTFWQHWPSILLKGLSCRGRTHIHLAPGLPGDPGVISGMRPNCEVAVFINGPLALADGIPFFRSANGVILTPGNTDGFLLPKYFKEALQLRPTRKPLSLSGNEETECQSGPKHSSRGRRTIQQ